MVHVLLPAGDAFDTLTLSCEVRAEACAGPQAPTGRVTLLPDYEPVQCCRPCLDARTRQGEWSPRTLEASAPPRRPAPDWDVHRPLSLDEAGERLADATVWFEEARQSEETHLKFGYVGDSLAVAFHGWRDAELLRKALTLVASEGIAPHVWRLRLSGEDEGLDGTRVWDLGPLGRGAVFSQLEVLDIEGPRPGDTVRTRLAPGEEPGLLARALERMPRLRRLSLPSAPDAAFFAGEPHALRELLVQCGDGAQGFIEGLARTQRFAQLEVLDFTDAGGGEAQGRTPSAAFDALFASRALPALRQVVLRGTVLDENDARRLRSTPLGRQLSELEVVPLAQEPEEG
jgi:hypothetical protein